MLKNRRFLACQTPFEHFDVEVGKWDSGRAGMWERSEGQKIIRAEVQGGSGGRCVRLLRDKPRSPTGRKGRYRGVEKAKRKMHLEKL